MTAIRMALAAGCVALGLPAAADDVDIAVAESMVAVARYFGPAEVTNALKFLNAAPDGITADTMGQVMVLRRRFDTAAMFYTLAASKESDAESLNNLAAMLAQVALPEPGAWPEDIMETALTLARGAAERAPEDPVVQNTLGSIAARLGRRDEARAAHDRAHRLAPQEPLYLSNLARDLAGLGDASGAQAALSEAHRQAAADPVVRFLQMEMPGHEDILLANCDIDFRCDEICPRSIIGGLLNVQCEMDNMSAVVACGEGRPFATSYDCNEDFPEYGILIPGLNAGFTAFVPGFKIHVLFNGDGQIDFRWEINTDFGPYGLLGAHAGSDGHYPRNGDIVLDNFQAGFDLELLPRDFNWMDPLDDADVPLAEIMMRGAGNKPEEMPMQDFDDAMVTF